MLIVGSGGSSRVDWICLLPDKSIQTIETRGLNPYFLSEKEIIKVLNSVKLFQEYSSIAKEIHFFGAGCNSPDKREIVSNALSVKFKIGRASCRERVSMSVEGESQAEEDLD